MQVIRVPACDLGILGKQAPAIGPGVAHHLLLKLDPEVITIAETKFSNNVVKDIKFKPLKSINS